jgi:hypothetical protein
MFNRATIRDMVGDRLQLIRMTNGDLKVLTEYSFTGHHTVLDFTPTQVRRIRDALNRFLGE